MQATDIAISLFDNSVPVAVETDLERLYQNPYSTLAHHRLYSGLCTGVSTYVARENGVATAVFLFRRENGRIRVLNEQIRIDADEINRFARYLFATFHTVDVISFHAIETDIRRIPFARQHFSCTEDIVLQLPATEQEYRARLGKATRSYINRYLNKLRRDFPALRHDVFLREQVSEHQVRSIVELNRARMAARHRDSYLDDAETERIVTQASASGLVSVITIDGRVCAGAINLRVRDHYFLKVVAHDSAYNDYRLGTLCCYLTICECIARGGREYHFLWGRYEYKYRLLGVQRDLDHLALYRSRMQMMRNGGLVLQNVYSGCSLRVRSWLLHKARQNDRAGAMLRMASRLVHWLRGLKNFLLPWKQKNLGARRSDKSGTVID